jgi:glutathione peroxidase
MSIYDLPIHTLDGELTTLAAQKGKTLLLVNVASRCRLTPQYEGIERLHRRYAEKGFSVLGFPCDQFRGQEPGTAAEIKTFCSTQYGVTFPLFEKIDVNGDKRHALYAQLVLTADTQGLAGDVAWNFEKFLVSKTGEVVARFRPTVDPEAPEVIRAVEASL